MPSIRLNMFLFKSIVNSFEQCLKPKTEKRQYDLLTTSTSLLGCDYQIYIVKGEEKQPKWLSFIQEYVEEQEIEDVLNKTCSMIILLHVDVTPTERRFFAISHGFGFHILNKERVEPNFGLISTLNSVDPTRIKSVDTRSLGIQTIQKREASNLFTDLGEFAFEFDSEILQIISGASYDSTLGTKLSGSDNLHLTTEVSFANLPSKCRAVYEKYGQSVYREKFDFVDHIRYEKDPQIIAELDQKLVEAVNLRQDDLCISVVYPDQIDYERSGQFRFSGLRRARSFPGQEVDDVTLLSVYRYLDNQVVDISHLKQKIKIIGIDRATDTPCTPNEPLYDYFVFETSVNNRKYVLTNRKWYYVDQDYLTKLEYDLQQYVIQLTEPILKPWPIDMKSEGDYNAQYNNEHDFICLDKALFSITGSGYSRIEVADIYHRPTNKLFFVKKLNRSATLSHLFSQATISADLFRGSSEYLDKFIQCLQDKWPDYSSGDDLPSKLTFVYTVGSTRMDGVVESLPLFSKINLLKHMKLLRKLNFQAQIAKVAIS